MSTSFNIEGESTVCEHNGSPPFYRDLLFLLNWSSYSHEGNVFRPCFQSKQRVNPFYRDFDFWFAWLGWESSACRATSLLLLVEQLLIPILFIQSCVKEIFGGGRGDAFTFL